MSATLLVPTPTRVTIFPLWRWMLPVFGVIALLGTMTAPLAMAVYGLLLLGVAHNLSEIRYLALRWGDQLRAGSLLSMLMVLIGCIAMTRLLSIAGWVTSEVGQLIEIGVMYVILAVAVRQSSPPSPLTLLRRARGSQSKGIGQPSVLGALGVAATLSFVFPQWHVLVFAHLHNLLPWWFVREAVPEGWRGRVDGVAGTILIAIPLLLLLGLGDGASLTAGSSLGGDWVAFSRGFVLPEWSGTLLGERILQMFAYAQLVHFLIWVMLMPRLLPPSMSHTAQPLLRRVDPWLLGIGIFGAVAFAWDFTTTRMWYPVFATWHAYLELPIMLSLVQSGRGGSKS